MEEDEEEKGGREKGENRNKSKLKRMRRKNRKSQSFKLKLLGNNVDGLQKKLESLEHLILTEKPAVLFFQETKIGRAGKIKTPSCKNFT